MKILSAKNLHLDQGIKCVVYGKGGAGKTTLAQTLLSHGPVLVLSAESGMLAVAGQDIDIIDITKDDEGKALKTATEKFKRLAESFKFITETPNLRHKTIFIDSLSEIADIIFNHTKDEIEASGKGDNGFKVWGDYANRMNTMLKRFRDMAKYNVVFTCLEDLDKDETGKMFYRPMVPGKAAKELIVPIFDEVFRLVITDDSKGIRMLLTSPTSTSDAKDRSGALEKLESPNLDKIFEKIRTHVQKKTEQTELKLEQEKK
jgi:GTPase SAR1 family protein